jgi:hypothetical protein
MAHAAILAALQALIVSASRALEAGHGKSL